MISFLGTTTTKEIELALRQVNLKNAYVPHLAGYDRPNFRWSCVQTGPQLGIESQV